MKQVSISLSGVPKATTKFDDLPVGLLGLTYHGIHGYGLLWQRIQREKVHEEKFRENQAQASKGPLPEESHRMCLILPASSWDNVYEN